MHLADCKDQTESDCKLTHVSSVDSVRHLENLKKFDALFNAEKANFNFSQDSTYYLISTRFLNCWRDFCTSHSPMRLWPTAVNEDLFEGGMPNLRPGLVEKEDFEIVSEQIYNMFKEFNPIQIKRSSIMVGTQKRVPIYLTNYQYLFIKNSDLRCIDNRTKTRESFNLATIQEAEGATAEEFLRKCADRDRYAKVDSMRLWKVQHPQNLDTLFKYLKGAALKATSEYRVRGFGKKVPNEATLGELQMQQGDFFVVEMKDMYGKWFLQTENDSKCEGCFEFAELKFACKCDKVKYCSQECQEKDKRWHMHRCEYAQMEELNKPVDMVLTQRSMRGIVGLKNLGNTCFMNSCLQCISNTIPLTEYFLNMHYTKEVNVNNPIGTKGKLAKNYAKFIKAMWCDDDKVVIPDGIKNAVSIINPMFSGYAQHDSQEFFSFLIDGLHEDLNRVLNKPYVQSVESNGKGDAEVALQSWIGHIRRNQSIVTDLMTGQYKSKVTCPVCSRQSITFDPFITVTLPIPENKQNILDVYHISHNMASKTKHIFVPYVKANPDQWLKSLASTLGIDEKRIVMYVVSMYEGIYRVGRDSKSDIVHKVEVQNKHMFSFQLSQEDLLIQDVLELTTRLSKENYYREYDNLWFKFPLFFERKALTGKAIALRVLKFLYGEAYKDAKSKFHLFGGKSEESYLEEMLVNRPFKIYLRTDFKKEQYYGRSEFKFAKEIEVNDEDRMEDVLGRIDTRTCELDIRFSKSGADKFAFENLKSNEEFGKKKKSFNNDDTGPVHLNQCFATLQQEEQLQAGNQWYCSTCKGHKKALKTMSIYKAPQILILHLKRFKQRGGYRKEKNETKVQFPMILDITQHVGDPCPMESYRTAAKHKGVYITPKYEPIQAEGHLKPIYELYAVSNHYGGLGGGHYTAYAKNDGRWYEFNDSSVHVCCEDDVCSSGAYILFYRRVGN